MLFCSSSLAPGALLHEGAPPLLRRRPRLQRAARRHARGGWLCVAAAGLLSCHGGEGMLRGNDVGGVGKLEIGPLCRGQNSSECIFFIIAVAFQSSWSNPAQESMFRFNAFNCLQPQKNYRIFHINPTCSARKSFSRCCSVAWAEDAPRSDPRLHTEAWKPLRPRKRRSRRRPHRSGSGGPLEGPLRETHLERCNWTRMTRSRRKVSIHLTKNPHTIVKIW